MNSMDELSSLPENNNAVLSPDDEKVIEYYFPPSPDNDDKKLKTIGYAALLFAALANPITSGLMENIPFCNDNPLCIMLVKIFIFVLVLFLLSL